MPQRETGRKRVDTPGTPGSTKPEPVENRPNVGVVEPDDYPDSAGMQLPDDDDTSPLL